jgi:hypothetical protein
MGQATNRSACDALDLVITNALIVDWSGIYKVRTPAFTLAQEISPARLPRLILVLKTDLS